MFFLKNAFVSYIIPIVLTISISNISKFLFMFGNENVIKVLYISLESTFIILGENILFQ